MSTADELLTTFRDYLLSRSDLLLQHFIEGFDWSAEERSLAPRHLPVVGYLRELGRPVDGAEAALFERLSNAADMLHWAQTYGITDFGADFLQRYGWVELFGTRGHFASEKMAGGFLLLGPGVHYPDHHHEAEEIYIPLTDGSLWSKDGQPFLPRWTGEIIHHPSNIRHAMRTEAQPLVALYLWRGGPLAQKSIISGRMQ
ncbi:transcriptional regulator [Rhizobium sp. P40RR-XXII]|uniref:dimethylsulfonioproprionate lyase family protein n=1 Tax=unclassified Rhizobium TaxID=2613769 RepID=UPI001456C7F0|nr:MULTISPECIES: dimethylsulfonioproprionate lyase family protein [unclassified Rhizobium]NLR83235.1 transcriptional regulator [Rhizobium sp. P28RR-XV]NLS15655.1 transcriptional regulator [Rhizobium sp. P40RR-XXII]